MCCLETSDKSMIAIAEEYSPELCLAHSDKLFVFGDNLIGKGRAGQACIRYCPNAFGIPTKRLPSMAYYAFFSDTMEERFAVKESLEKLKCIAPLYQGGLVFPAAGLGTGLARLKELSPTIWDFLNTSLYEMFGFDNNV